MIVDLVRNHFRKFIIELGNSYMEEENAKFLKSEEITKVSKNKENEYHLFKEVHEPLNITNLDCGTLDIKKTIKKMDLYLLYDSIYDDDFQKDNELCNSKLYKMFDVVCLNVHKEIYIKNVHNSVIYVDNTHGTINISDCNNCLIVGINVHKNINIRNCIKCIFITDIVHHSSPKYKNISDCKELLLKDEGRAYTLINLIA